MGDTPFCYNHFLSTWSSWTVPKLSRIPGQTELCGPWDSCILPREIIVCNLVRLSCFGGPSIKQTKVKLIFRKDGGSEIRRDEGLFRGDGEGKIPVLSSITRFLCPLSLHLYERVCWVGQICCCTETSCRLLFVTQSKSFPSNDMFTWAN